MADLSKLKRRNSLGSPPAPEEASQNLTAPETAPIPSQPQASSPSNISALGPQEPTQVTGERIRLDARSLRKTGRTLQFATRVSWEFDEKLRHIAQRDGLLLVEVLEHALEAYEQQASQ